MSAVPEPKRPLRGDLAGMAQALALADAQALYDACGSQDKTLRVFTSDEGGAQHCQRDYLTLGCATMWDWFEDKLVRRD